MSTALPKMHIFDYGEVHFNGNIYCDKHNESIFKYKNLPNLLNLPATENIELSKHDKPWAIDKFIINKEFINSGYGNRKVRLLPGDWIVI